MSTAAQKRRLSPLQSQDEETVFVSAPIHDRSSTFMAHFHPHVPKPTSSAATQPLSVTSTIKTYQSHPDFAKADHRMVAWRRPSTQQTLGSLSSATATTRVIHTTGSDDDGEKYAGKRLERVLIDLDVAGTVVVARWYGGVLLGPVRFTHIENTAKEAIRQWQESTPDRASGAKRHKGEAERTQQQQDPTQDAAKDEADRVRLARQLTERDNSIVVLRGLLNDKTKSGSTKTDTTMPPSSSQASTSSPVKKIDYGEMPLARLRQLEKARDATIAFILKQIDKAEEEEEEEEEEEAAAAAEGGGIDQAGHRNEDDT